MQADDNSKETTTDIIKDIREDTETTKKRNRLLQLKN